MDAMMMIKCIRCVAKQVGKSGFTSSQMCVFCQVVQYIGYIQILNWAGIPLHALSQK